MKKAFCFLSLLIMSLVFCTPSLGEGFRFEGPGFDTPEDALTCYVDGIRELDFEKILSSFAWETQISHYTLEKQFARTKTYSTSTKPRIPSVHPFVTAANLESLRSVQVDNLCYAIEFLLMGENHHDGMPQYFKTDAELAAYMDNFDTERLELLSGITNIRFLSPETIIGEKFLSEKNRQSFLDYTDRYGGDEAVNIIALGDLPDGEIFYCCPTIVRYSDKWYVVSTASFTSAFLGISPFSWAFFCGSADMLNH